MFRRSSRQISSSHLDYRPAARKRDIELTASKEEVLIYDTRVHHIHHLNPLASHVWKRCDGRRTIDQIAEEMNITSDAVCLSLRQLGNIDLIDGSLPEAVRHGESRRSFMKKAGLAAVPAIVSITAPMAKAAASLNPPAAICEKEQPCLTLADCCIPLPDKNGNVPDVYCDGEFCRW